MQIIFFDQEAGIRVSGPESGCPLLAPGDVPLPAGVSVPTGTQGDVPAKGNFLGAA